MNRKSTFLTLVMAFVMLFAFSATALAAPSPTMPDLSGVTDIEIENPDVPMGNFIMDMFAEMASSNNPKVRKVYEKIEKFLKFFQEKKGKASEVFGKKVLDLIAEILPEGYNIDDLNLNELVAFVAMNYNEEFGDVTAMLEFATEYKTDEQLVAIVGIYSEDDLNSTDNDEKFEDKADWRALEAEVVRDKDGKNKVKVKFTKEVLKDMGSNPVALGILNGKKGR